MTGNTLLSTGFKIRSKNEALYHSKIITVVKYLLSIFWNRHQFVADFLFMETFTSNLTVVNMVSFLF